jgi:phosphoribosylformylglycinamidine synthase PurS subunit
MAKIIVEVMLKAEILDPQGQAVSNALPRLGFNFARSVRQGKLFEIEMVGNPTPEQMVQINHVAETLLANPVIETFVVKVEK